LKNPKATKKKKGDFMKSCSVVDLFCGVGGLTHGLELAGLNVVAGIDINETCKFAYEANNTAEFILRDITSISSEDLEVLYKGADIKVLVGCAPCQPFSKYTKRYRKEGSVGDKWRLLYSFSKLIKEVKPKVIAMENVPELAKEQVFSDFVVTLKSEGYYCSWGIVCCQDYGVPQNRKRLVLLASLLGDIYLIPPLYNRSNYITVRDAIGNMPALQSGEEDENDPLHRSAKLSNKNLVRIRQSVQGGTWRDWDENLKLECHKRETGKGYGAVYGRMSWDKPAPTITTLFYGYGNGRFGHPEQDRAISYREGAILQSFPPNYKFTSKCTETCNLRELGIHIGNAVPVGLGKAIGLSINQHLETHIPPTPDLKYSEKQEFFELEDL
jgi:DNA (cytosine-5)-methyltransferase 1